jgi:hypothetical protein
MSIELLFWIIMLIWVLAFGFWWTTPTNPYVGRFHPVILWILLALLGYKVFGPMVHS